MDHCNDLSGLPAGPETPPAFGLMTMERRSERLANQHREKPISYRETGVKRVFKKIRRKRKTLAIQGKLECKTQMDGSFVSSDSEEEMQPCCSKNLPDQRHLLAQYSFETPRLKEAKSNVQTCQNPKPLVLASGKSVWGRSPDPELGGPSRVDVQWPGSANILPVSQSGERSRQVMEMLIVLPLLLMLVGISGYLYPCLRPPSNISRLQESRQSCEDENPQQYFGKQVNAFGQQVAGLQSLLGDVHEEIKQRQFTQKDVSRTVNEYLPLENAALKSAGASVVKTSKSFPSGARVCMWGLCWEYSRSPDVILEWDNEPGNCWAMDGSEGYVTIQLSREIRPTHVTLQHVSKKQSHTDRISSAPKYFNIYGLKDDDKEEEGTLLGAFSYRINGFSTQTFRLQEENVETFKYVQLKIFDNWGHPNYTCIYGVRVYGD